MTSNTIYQQPLGILSLKEVQKIVLRVALTNDTIMIELAGLGVASFSLPAAPGRQRSLSTIVLLYIYIYMFPNQTNDSQYSHCKRQHATFISTLRAASEEQLYKG